ncbi:MAG: hypothetical protein ACTHU0_06410 [Kofleriaceae bacterium]
MDDQERERLAAVAADVDSDGPRLEYAEWLLAQGRGWGELVRISVAAGDAPDEVARKAMSKVLRAHAKDGLGAAYPFVKRDPTFFARGFPRLLTASAVALAKCAEEVGLRAPGATLHLSAVKDKHIDALAPAVRGFRGGELYVDGLKDRGVQRLCDSGMLAGFGELKLFGCNFGEAGVAALAGCATADRIRDLAIDLRLELAPIFGSTALTELTQITAHSARIGEALRVCRRSFYRLQISGLDDFDDEDAQLLARSPSAASVSSLSLARSPRVEAPTALTRAGVLALIEALPRISGLWLYGFTLPRELASELTAVLDQRRARFYEG